MPTLRSAKGTTQTTEKTKGGRKKQVEKQKPEKQEKEEEPQAMEVEETTEKKGRGRGSKRSSPKEKVATSKSKKAKVTKQQKEEEEKKPEEAEVEKPEEQVTKLEESKEGAKASAEEVAKPKGKGKRGGGKKASGATAKKKGKTAKENGKAPEEKPAEVVGKEEPRDQPAPVAEAKSEPMQVDKEETLEKEPSEAISEQKQETLAKVVHGPAEPGQIAAEPVTLEKGHIYFFYRPKVQPVGETPHPTDIEDVHKLYILLVADGDVIKTGEQLAQPQRTDVAKRLIAVAKKKLPDISARERLFAFVIDASPNLEEIKSKMQAEEYSTATRGERELPAMRPAGEDHDRHTHLAYVLEFPEEPGDVQDAFNIRKEGSFIVSVKNPEAGASFFKREKRAQFPEEMQKAFEGRRFNPIRPPSYLDYMGAELLLIGGHEKPETGLGKEGEELKEFEELDKESEPVPEKLYEELRLSHKEFPPDPLIKGEWK